jgi:hypothetical protein
MKVIQIHCDYCGKDITTTGAMPAYRINLHSERIPSNSIETYAVMVYPDIKEDEYYCNLKCLKAKLAD